jgi:hypothetical protein
LICLSNTFHNLIVLSIGQQWVFNMMGTCHWY